MTTSPRTVAAAEVARWVADGEALIVDVRSPEEFRGEHIADALSLPLEALPGALDALTASRGQRLVFQCRGGGRGAAACSAVEAAWPEAWNLEGGIEGWKAAGLPVVRAAGAPATLPLFRQVQIAVGLIVAALVAAGFLVAPAFFALAGFIGLMLAIAGATGWCGMALLLQRMPWNRVAAS